MTDIELLERVGVALFGVDWRNPMAFALHVSQRTVRHWLTGRYPIGDGVWRDLAELCRAQRDIMGVVLMQLEARVGRS